MQRSAFHRGLSVIGLAVALSASSTARAYEFGCLDPEYRDGSFFVEGAWDVVDGDTVVVGKFTVNLISIDAPEIGQMCLSREGEEFDCGKTVAQLLESKFLAAGPIATCLVHFVIPGKPEGEGFCGTFATDRHFHVECIQQDFGGELARDGYARATAVGEFPTSSLYWAGHQAAQEKRGLFAGTILPTQPTSP